VAAKAKTEVVKPEKKRCRATTRRGNPCKHHPIPGGFVCFLHGGAAPQTKAKAAVRAAVMHWGLSDVHADPGETLLRLVSQSSARVAHYSRELERLVGEGQAFPPVVTLEKILIGDAWGEGGKQGEYIRGMVALESTERDRCANFCRLAIAAGLAERQVKLAERQGALMAELLREVLADPALGLTATQRGAVPGLIRQHLALVK
jgi:hypothetical protein